MPKGIPVATVAINGAYNAGLLAAQIIAVSDQELTAKLVEMRLKMAEAVREKDKGWELGARGLGAYAVF